MTAPWKVIVYFGSDGAMYANTITPDGIKVDSNGQKINENVINAKSYIGTYRTESGHAIGGSQGFTITIQKIENNKIWGAFSWGGRFKWAWLWRVEWCPYYKYIDEGYRNQESRDWLMEGNSK